MSSASACVYSLIFPFKWIAKGIMSSSHVPYTPSMKQEVIDDEMGEFHLCEL